MNARQRRTVKRKVKKHGLFWPGTPVSKREARHIKARWKRRYGELALYFDEVHPLKRVEYRRHRFADFVNACAAGKDRVVTFTVSVKDGKIEDFIPANRGVR